MKLEDLLPELLIEVKGCDHFTAEGHLRRAARAFCQATHVWTLTLEAFNTQAAVGGYDLPVPEASSVVRLSQVDVGDQKDVEILDQQEAKTEQGRESQSTFVWLEGAQLHVNPVPAASVPVVVQCSLKPSLTAAEVPDWLAEDHAETFRLGAKGTLLGVPKVDWSDPVAGQMATRQFNGRCDVAAIQKTKGRAVKRRRAPTFY